MPFASTPAKDQIRSSFDKKVLTEFSGKKKRTLSYFGLCGPQMLDIIEWREYLGPCCAIEHDDPLKFLKLWDTAFEEDLHQNLEVLHGDIDYVMREWKDNNGTEPALASYDVLNLDYEGGIIYKDLSGNSKRLRAIFKMVERQSEAKEDFVLFITVNTRNKGQNDFDLVLQEIEREAKQWPGVSISKVIEWYKAQRFDQKLKVYLPYVLGRFAVPLRFDLVPISTVSYIGAGDNRMVHFEFELRFHREKAAVAEMTSLIEVLRAPLTQIQDGKIQVQTLPQNLLALLDPGRIR